MITKEKIPSRAKQHTVYRLKDGTRVPGVTTITGQELGWNKEVLKNWANKIGLQGIEVKKYTDDKADIGTLAHALILDELQGKTTDTDEYSKIQISAAENSALSFYEWAKGKKIEPILIEQPLISEKWGYGGQPDFYGKVDDLFELIDLKTGKGIYEEYFVQSAGYWQLLEENGYPVQRERILNIPRSEDESFAQVIVPCIDSYLHIFLNLLGNRTTRNLIKTQIKGDK